MRESKRIKSETALGFENQKKNHETINKHELNTMQKTGTWIKASDTDAGLQSDDINVK
jgi:spore germination protein GerM